MYAENALHLLRDALLDAEGIASVLTAAALRRAEIERQQVEEMIFHGPLHEDYHDALRQVRATTGAGIAQTKRILNQTADVVDAFVAHGTPLRSRSFGSQIASLAAVPRQSFDSRTNEILRLLRERGKALDESTYFRDKFLEHVHPYRDREQPRPMSGDTVLGFKTPQGDVMSLEDVIESDFNWVRFIDRTGGREREYFVTHVVVAGPGSGPEVVHLDRHGLTGHFRSNDPHRHIFEIGRGGKQLGINVSAIVASSDLAHLHKDALEYVAALLTCCEHARLA
jgi:hypothetical protein